MNFMKKLIAFLNPIKELIVLVVFLAGAAYTAFTYFATAEQVAKSQKALEDKLAQMQIANQAAMEELRCRNALNRDLLAVQIQEVSLRTLLEQNLQKTEQAKLENSAFARVELARLQANFESHVASLAKLSDQRAKILADLQDGRCSQST